MTYICWHCREPVLDAAAIDDAAETLLRDHLLVLHVHVLQPETREHLMLHFDVHDLNQ